MTMRTYHITIADRIKAYRDASRLTQSEFGKMIGVSAQAIYKWEKGICYPDMLFLPHLAQIMDCKIDDFFQTDEESL